jgi:hypothetical protein
MRLRIGIVTAFLLWLVLVSAVGDMAYGQQRQNFDLLAQVQGSSFTAFAIAGRTVFVVQGNGLVAVDMSNPARPVEMSRRTLNLGPISSCTLTNGRYLFLRTVSNGLQIYNVTNPRSPLYVGRFAPYDSYHPSALALEGNRLYFGGTSFRIFDVTNPLAPSLLANLPYPSNKIALSQGRALVSGSDTSPLRVYDVRQPGHPVYLAELNYSHTAGGWWVESIWHEAIAMRWPNPLVVNGAHWTEWLYPYPYLIPVYWSGLSIYSPGYGGAWNRVESAGDTEYYSHDRVFRKVAQTSNKVFAATPLGVPGYDARTLRALSTIPMFYWDLATSGNLLYALDAKRVAVYDAGSSPTFPLRGAYDVPGGSVAAMAFGRAYVLGKVRGLTTLDVRVPTAPRIAARGPAIADARAAVVGGSYLYVADADAGLRVLSLANPDSPQEVRVARFAGGATDVAISGNKAYVAGGSRFFRIFDLTNPTSPVTIGVLPNRQDLYEAVSVAVSGNYAYLLVNADGPVCDLTNLFVVNVTNPRSPQVVGSHLISYGPKCGDLAIYGNSLFVLVGRSGPGDSPPPVGPVFDISNPAALKNIGQFASGDRVSLAYPWAFVTGGPHGLDAYMIANPRNVVHVGYVAGDHFGVAASSGLVCTASESDGIRFMRFLQPNKVDLTYRDFALATPTLAPGQMLKFSGSILNIGPLATTQSFWVSFPAIPLDRSASPVNLCDSVQVTTRIAAGGLVNLAPMQRPLYGPSRGVLPGRYLAAMVIDPYNQIAEGREDNNIAFAATRLTVLASLNDLRPASFSFAPDQVTAGQNITLSGQIAYTGTQTTTSGFWVAFQCSPNPDFRLPRYRLCGSLWIGPGLAPGTVRSFSITRPVNGPGQGLPTGLYVVGVIVDETNLIPESNEMNNTLWRSGDLLLVR